MHKSLVVIRNSQNNNFGIGTVIYQNRDYKYILTSANLVEKSPKNIIVDSQTKTKIIYQGSSRGLDLAILKVSIDNPPITLREDHYPNIGMDIKGFAYESDFKSISYHIYSKETLRTYDGVNVYGWRLKSYIIQDGSPIISKESGEVIAIMSRRQNFAISIENLKLLGREIPRNLIEHKNYIPKIFISLAHRNPEMHIAKKISEEFKKRGYRTFLAITDIKAGENWVERLYRELEECEYFIILLSKSSIESEMVAEEINSIKELQNEFGSPEILPIRVKLPYAFNAHYEILKQLDSINQLMWEKEEDTTKIIDILDRLISKKEPIRSSEKKALLSLNTFPLVTQTVSLEHPTGIVPFDSKNYVQRDDDIKCYENLSDRYSLIRIKAPNKYGKTSLLERINLYAQKSGYNIVSINFQRDFEKSTLSNLDELLSCVCDMISEELNIEININQRVLKRATSKLKATKYMNKLLSLLDKPLVLSIDEADKLFKYKEVSDDFFSLIRAWHEKSKVNRNWENLKLVLAHSTEPLLGLTTLDQSPFDNVGLGVELSAFNKQETKNLALGHGIELSDLELEELFMFIGGHPMLTRNVLYTMFKENKGLEEIIKSAYSHKNIFYDHLRRYLWIIEKNQKLELFLKEILTGKVPYDDISSYILEATGLVIKRNNKISFACELYRVFFKEHLRKG